MNDETVKRGRGRPPKSPEEKAHTRELAMVKKKLGISTLGQDLDSGDNARYLAHALVVMEQPPIDITNPQEVEERIKWYFEHCVNSDMKPTVSGMCNAIGIHRDTLHSWKVGDRRRGSGHQEVVLRAYRVLEELWEDYMLNGKVNPVAGIFLGKNLFQYKDQQEYVVTPNTGMPEAIDAATLEEKYAELPDYEE